MPWPAWATERVELVESDPSWPARGMALAAELDEVLSPWLVAAVEHVGSTAVPGLPAKPVFDLMAAVPDPDALVRAGLARLTAAGWVLVPPELDARPWRRSPICSCSRYRPKTTVPTHQHPFDPLSDVPTMCGMTGAWCPGGSKTFTFSTDAELEALHSPQPPGRLLNAGLMDSARDRLAALGYRPTLAAVDGVTGLPEHAPYDRILATCAASRVPWFWVEQTTEGGLILIDLKICA